MLPNIGGPFCVCAAHLCCHRAAPVVQQALLWDTTAPGPVCCSGTRGLHGFPQSSGTFVAASEEQAILGAKWHSSVGLRACLTRKMFWCCFAVAHSSAIFVCAAVVAIVSCTLLGLPVSGRPFFFSTKRLAAQGPERKATAGAGTHRPVAQVARPKGQLLSGQDKLSTMSA